MFGEVTEGLDVVEDISRVKVSDNGGFQMVPVKPVVIHSVSRE